MTEPTQTPTITTTAPAVATTVDGEVAAPPSSNDSSISKKKTVYLIRHAHSMENQRIASMFSCFGDLGRFTMPKKSDVNASLELLKLEHDAPLSDLGIQQCRLMKEVLNPAQGGGGEGGSDADNYSFVRENKIELVVHSPLERARQTCQELIGYSSKTSIDPPIKNGKDFISQSFKMSTTTANSNSTASTTTAASPSEEKQQQQQQSSPSSEEQRPQEERQSVQKSPQPRVVSLNLLEEKHQLEWVPGNTAGFEKRVIGFQKWLSEQPESVICVVGHSQYFKKMLELPYKFDNTDVYKVTFDPTPLQQQQQQQQREPVSITLQDGTLHEGIRLNPDWYDLELLHPCCRQSSSSASSEEDEGC